MINKKNELIASILTFTFFMILGNNLSSLLQNLMQVQFDLPYSKTLANFDLTIITSYFLGVLPLTFIKSPHTKKREPSWREIKRNQRILIGISFLLNILIWFIFLYIAKTQLLLSFSTVLFADSMVFMLTYGLGIATVYFIEFICKKIDKKAAKYGDNEVKEKRFRGIVKGVVFLCSVALLYLNLIF